MLQLQGLSLPHPPPTTGKTIWRVQKWEDTQGIRGALASLTEELGKPAEQDRNKSGGRQRDEWPEWTPLSRAHLVSAMVAAVTAATSLAEEVKSASTCKRYSWRYPEVSLRHNADF